MSLTLHQCGAAPTMGQVVMGQVAMRQAVMGQAAMMLAIQYFFAILRQDVSSVGLSYSQCKADPAP